MFLLTLWLPLQHLRFTISRSLSLTDTHTNQVLPNASSALGGVQTFRARYLQVHADDPGSISITPAGTSGHLFMSPRQTEREGFNT